MLPGQDDFTRKPVYADHFTQTNCDVSLMPQHGSDGQRNIGWRQGRGRNLIQQRLEQVIIAAVDQCDPAGRPAERMDGRDPAKAASYDDDMRDGITCPILHLHMAANPPGSQAVERQPPRALRCKQQQQQRDSEPVRRLAGEENGGANAHRSTATGRVATPNSSAQHSRSSHQGAVTNRR